MAQRSYSSSGPLKRAMRWDARLPKPLLALLILELMLVLPLPFLVPRVWQSIGTNSLPPAAELWQPLPTTVPRRQAQGEAIMASATPPLLIDPTRLQAAGGYSTNVIATLLAHANPDLAAVTIDVGDGIQQSLASVITGQALRWNINPVLVLSLFETQGRWLSQPLSPTQPLTTALRGPATAAGLQAQITWATLELRAGLLETPQAVVMLKDGTFVAVPREIDQQNYALFKFLALTHTQTEFEELLGTGPHSWVSSANRLMGDPRQRIEYGAVDRPFLRTPFHGAIRPTARFDHDLPLVERNAFMLAGDDLLKLGYDGHSGWDYELAPGTPITAAAAGNVLFAGWIYTGCATPAGVVVLQHPNGYSTSYWHLQSIDTQPGSNIAAGDQIGRNGSSGCSDGAHLHFSVQRLGRDTDPGGWCRSKVDPWAQHAAGTSSSWLWLDQRDPCSLGPGAVIVDETHTAWSKHSGGPWTHSDAGNFASAAYVRVAPATPAAMKWQPELPHAQSYQVVVFIPEAARAAGTAIYQISSNDGIVERSVNQGIHAGSWMSLGIYRFAAGQRGYVALQSQAATIDSELWIDAVAWIPVEP